MAGHTEVVIPLDYSSSRRIVDILLRRALLRLRHSYGGGRANGKLLGHILPRGCSVLVLQHQFPAIVNPSPVILGLDNLTANRLMGTFHYNQWMEEQLRSLIRSQLLPRQTRHIVLRPFLKSLRPENRLHESLEQIHVLHGLSYPSAWRGSFRDYVNSISRAVLGKEYAEARTGDLPSQWLEQICLELFRCQEFLVYSCHSKTLHYLQVLAPTMWVAPISILKLGLDPNKKPILMDREALLLQEFVYPSLHAQDRCAAPGLTSEEEVEDEDEDEAGQDDDWDSSESPQRPEGGWRWTESLTRCPAISPDAIVNGGQQAIFQVQRLEQALARRGDPELKSLVIIFLPISCGGQTLALVCDHWTHGSNDQQLVLKINAGDMDSADSQDPLRIGSGHLVLCGFSAAAEPGEIYHWARTDPRHLPVEMMEPLLLLARIDGYRFHP